MLVSVKFTRLRGVVRGMKGMPVGDVRVMSGGLVITGFMMFSGLPMKLRGVLVMVGCLFVMVGALVGHWIRLLMNKSGANTRIHFVTDPVTLL